MMHISKLSAAALALALSVTMVAPITANAEVIDTWETDASGKEVHTYKNEDTGESLSQKDYDINALSAENVLESKLKKLTISTNSYNEMKDFTTTTDVARYENFRSNSKNLSIKIIKKVEYRNLVDEKNTDFDYTSKDGKTWYYVNVNGDIVAVDASKADTDMPKGRNKAWYDIRFYTKKAGTYKVKYDAILKNGGKVTKSFDIIAVEDGNAIKSLTYAGMNVFAPNVAGKDPGNRLWEKGFGYGVTTKKSGVLKVVMNKNFKLKKLEVGEPSIEYKQVADESTQEMHMDYTATNTSLNKYFDKTIAWKKVKSGKKIKLKTIDDGFAGGIYLKGWEFGLKSPTTDTYIRVTYRDVKNKETKRETYIIRLVQE